MIYTEGMSALDKDVEMLESAMRLFFQTMKRPQNWADITAEAGISLDRPAAIILHILVARDKKHLRVHDLAAQLGIEAPSVTRKTQELERQGYLKRVADPVDRRAISLQITAKGRAASVKLWKVQRGRLAKVMRDWDPAERRQFVELFHRYSTDMAASTKPTKQI